METYSHIGGYSYPARVYRIRRAVGQKENPITFKRQLEEEGSINKTEQAKLERDRGNLEGMLMWMFTQGRGWGCWNKKEWSLVPGVLGS